MRRLWEVTVTVVEDWEAIVAIAVRQFEVLAESAPDAERVISEYLRREYRCAAHEVKFEFRQFVISPLLCDMNAIRDGLVPAVRCLD